MKALGATRVLNSVTIHFDREMSDQELSDFLVLVDDIVSRWAERPAPQKEPPR